MDLWKSHSNPGIQLSVSAACALVGLILLIGFRDFRGFGTNTSAGFLLGVLLLAIGGACLFLSGKQTVTVDPVARRITIEDANLFQTKKRDIPFTDIVSVAIGYQGKRSACVTWYYLVLKLRNGEEYPLFAPGRFFAGGTDRTTVSDWKQRLERYLGR